MRKADLEGLQQSIWEMNEIMAGRMKPGRVWTSEDLLGTELPDSFPISRFIPSTTWSSRVEERLRRRNSPRDGA